MRYYDEFYAKGGWRYRSDKALEEMQRLIVEPLFLEPRMRVLEIGCGQGFHSYALYQLGMDVTGNDLSKEGIKFAESNFAGPSWIQADTEELNSIVPENYFDVILARGHSWFHYELIGNPILEERLKKILKLLRPGGIFVLQIKTNFTGTLSNGKDPASYTEEKLPLFNKYDDYINLFNKFGKIILVTDWDGKKLKNDEEARKSGRNIVIAIKK